MSFKQEQEKRDERNIEESGFRTVLISFEVGAKANRFLTEAADKSGRTKRQEAKLRLENHLMNYESIVDSNTAIKRKRV